MKNNYTHSLFVLTNKIDILKEEVLKVVLKTFNKIYIIFDRIDLKTVGEFLKDLDNKSLKKFVFEFINPSDNRECYIYDTKLNTYFLHFANARNLLWQRIDTDWVVWLDSDDDIISFTQKYSQFFKKFLKDFENEINSVVGIFVPYFYNHETTYFYYALRVVKPYFFTWGDNPVHETLTLKESFRNKNYKLIYSDKIIVRHLKDQSQISNTVLRNVRILSEYISEKMSKKETYNPVLQYYLGRELLTLENFENEALVALEKAIDLNISKDYLILVYYLIASIYLFKSNILKALEYIDFALSIDSIFIDALIFKAKLLLALQHKQVAETLLNVLESYLKNDSIILHNYTLKSGFDINYALTEFYTLKLQYTLEFNIENADKVLSEFNKNIPKNYRMYEKYKEFTGGIVNIDDLVAALSNWSQTYKIINEKIKKNDLNSLKSLNIKSNFLVNIIDSGNDDSDIVFYCPQNFEVWDPNTILKNGGGGSETALAQVSKILVEKGFRVVVYANPPEEGYYENVLYKNYNNIDFTKKFKYFIIFRDQGFLRYFNIKADKIYLWSQDVGNPYYFGRESLKKYDKIIVLSNYHRQTFFYVPEEKIFYTTNGIDINLIQQAEKEINLNRDVNKFLYLSSPLRGLMELLNIWDQLIESGVITNEQLFWYYGWASTINSKHNKEKVNETVNLVNFYNTKFSNNFIVGDRIGKIELYKEMLTSNFLFYPYNGNSETSCIVLMEAQACGLIPVTTGLDALRETQKFGFKFNLVDFKNAVEYFIKNKNNFSDNNDEILNYRTEMKTWARQKYDWYNVLNDWIKNLFNS
ncbi:MAG: hypothetical protein NZZ41_04220 [Candidatus Dojkabacteria bacterium]|nr:hypothetical protein [Candidatus Dojkabacteria bacterium]